MKLDLNDQLPPSRIHEAQVRPPFEWFQHMANFIWKYLICQIWKIISEFVQNEMWLVLINWSNNELNIIRNLHLGLDCKNSGCGLGLSIGQEVGRWWTSFFKVTIISTIG
jgi:hypothetical protein